MFRCRGLAALVAVIGLGAQIAEADIRIGTAAPMTGPYAWAGERYQLGAGLAVADLNAKGGVLGERVELIVGDDFCDPDQAVALARKLVSDRVVFVAGHWCSQASIPASKVYEHAEVLMIAPGSVNSALTDEGGPNVFRVCGRDDQQAVMVADYIARHWAGKGIAVVDDGTLWGKGIADKTRLRLRERDGDIKVDEAYAPGQEDFTELVSRMQAADVGVVFVGGFHREAGLILRQARERGYGLQLIANSAMALEDFSLIAGPALEGTVMAGPSDTRDLPQAADVVARFQADGYEPLGYTLYAYAAVQVWAQSVAEAGSFDLQAVTRVMHSRRFDTVLGAIGFDEKGDVVGLDPWQWFIWQADGEYVPLRQ